MLDAAEVQDDDEERAIWACSSDGSRPDGIRAAWSRLRRRSTGVAQALTRIGAAVCEGAPGSMFGVLVSEARAAGATDEEVLGVLLCVACTGRRGRLVSAVPGISHALGYDLDEAFESG